MWTSVHLELTFCCIYSVINFHAYPSHCLSVSPFILMPPCIPSLLHLVQVVYLPLLLLLFLLRYNLDTVRCTYIKWTISEILRCKYLCNPIPIQIQNIKSPQNHPLPPVNHCLSQSPRQPLVSHRLQYEPFCVRLLSLGMLWLHSHRCV